jgi:hypothetical protein
MTAAPDSSLRSAMIIIVPFPTPDLSSPAMARTIQAQHLWRRRAHLRARAEAKAIAYITTHNIDPGAPSGDIYVRIMPSEKIGQARFSVRLRVGPRGGSSASGPPC